MNHNAAQPRVRRACLLVTCAFATAVCRGDITGWHPENPKTRKSDLVAAEGNASVEQAVRAANEFFKKLGISANGEATVTRVFNGSIGRGFYEIAVGDLWLTVDLRSTSCTSFLNAGRERDRAKGIRLPGPPVIRNAIQCRSRLNRLAKAVGAGAELRLQLKQGPEAAGQPSRAEYTGPIIGTYEPMPYGFPFHGAPERYYFDVDPMDGALVRYRYSKHYSYIIDAHVAKLKFEQADVIARKTAIEKKLGLGVGVGRTAGPPKKGKPSFLGYVHDPKIPEVGRGAERLCHCRLAWVICYPGEDEVWVDAGDGRILGYVSIREALERKPNIVPPKIQID